MSGMNFLFALILGLSTFIAMSSNSWFQLWVALEVNMMVFVPMMFNNDNLSINSAMKYFIIQTFASSIFIMTMLMDHNFMWPSMFNSLISLSLCSKLGLFPLYFWFPQVSEGLTWGSFILLSTWQKLIPMYMLATTNKNIMVVILVASAFVSCLGAFNQTSLRKLFAYSSISHMAWMLLSMIYESSAWMVYFAIYSTIMLCMLMLTKTNNMSTTHHLKMTFFNMNLMASFTMILMSLGGLPPLLGFLPKWMIISSTPNSLMLILFTLITTSLVMIFIYLRILFPLLFNKSMLNPKYNFTTMSPLLINAMLLIPLMPLIFF